MQVISVIGHIGQDAEWRSENGAEYGRFSIAANTKGRDGAADVTTWYTVFTKQKNLIPYLTRGGKVFVSGDLSLNIYKDQQGNHRVGARISNVRIQLLGSAQDRQQQQAPVTSVAMPDVQQIPELNELAPNDLPF